MMMMMMMKRLLKTGEFCRSKSNK